MATTSIAAMAAAPAVSAAPLSDPVGLAIASQPGHAVVCECTVERTRHWSLRVQAYVSGDEKRCS